MTSNCVNPGYVRTPLVLEQILLAESAIKRLVEHEVVAALVGFLASPQADMVTGASYTMDGGWSAR